jgi:hypothetical protein
MTYKTVADIFSANKKIREGFVNALSAIPEEEAAVVPEGEKWSIRQIVEHVSMVDHGIARICGKLLEAAKASGRPSNGTVAVSSQFLDQAAAIPNTKLEAPAVVHPSGNVPISDSIKRMTENQRAFEALRGDLEAYDLSEPKYPHPYFGPMTAAEWLVLAGGHELRHQLQIQRIFQKMRIKDPGQKEGDPTGVRTSN